MKSNNKGGRPKKGAAEKLNYKITVKLCTKDYYSLKAAAKTTGIRLAELARKALLGLEIKPRMTPSEAGVMRQLSGMANNLNQIAKQANISGYANMAEENERLAGEISAIIKQTRNDG